MMKNCPLVTVIILNYNGFNHTSECIKSVRQSTYKPLSLIVVDNASTDNSVIQLKEILAPDELIELSINGGYTYGNNIGIEHAFNKGADYVFIINNDTVIDPNCVKYLVEAAIEHDEIGIIGPKVLYYSDPEKINFAGITGNLHKAKYNRIGLNQIDNGQYEELVDTFYQDGCALMVSRTCFSKIGGFDESLWAYSEDTDLCMRAKLAGFRVCCLQSAKMWHKISASFGDHYRKSPLAMYYSTRNMYIFHRRYAGSFLRRIGVILILFGRMPRRFLSILFKSKENKWMNFYIYVAATVIGILTNINNPSDILAPIKTVKRTS
jgi:hypothetical protein